MDDVLRRRVLAEAVRLRADLTGLFDELSRNPENLLARAFPVEDPAARTPSRVLDDGTEGVIGGGPGGRIAIRPPVDGALVGESPPFEAGRRGLEKIARAGTKAELDDDELLDLETIIIVAVRPAILIQQGRFLAPAPPWQQLEDSRPAIENVARSVGRVQITGSRIRPFAGTGFVVGPDLVMTNRHVAETFGEVVDGVFAFEPGMSSAVDFADDPDTDDAPEFSLRGAIIHPTLDLALLHVESRDRPLPAPLALAAEPPAPPAPDEAQQVYVVGYPGQDRAHDEKLVQEVMGDVFNVKRLQPGGIMTIFDEQPQFNHDCSTLGGNSGSCVVDLPTHRVLGLHFAGKFLKFNRAVALWRLQDDPLLQGVNFVDR